MRRRSLHTRPPDYGTHGPMKHSTIPQVTQGAAGRSNPTRGAQQGYAEGPFEASAALAEQARATTARRHQARAKGAIQWSNNPAYLAQCQAEQLDLRRVIRNRAQWLAMDPKQDEP